MIKIELDNGTIVLIDGKEVMQADEFKKMCAYANSPYRNCGEKLIENVKVEILLEYLDFIKKASYKFADSDNILGMIRGFCDVAKKEVSDIN